MGKILTDNILGYGGDVYPVNPNRDRVFGKETFSSLSDIPFDVDLVVIATNASKVPEIMRESGEKGIPAAIVISSGFGEAGRKGKSLERELSEIRKKYGMRVLGPNSLGILRPSKNLNATISDKMSERGSIAFISQSGALGPSILHQKAQRGLGLSAFVSVGNMIDVDFGDLIDYFGRDPATRTILMHVESIRNPEKFISSARGFAKAKPIILEKAGRYPKSSDAVVSHIGFSFGDDLLYNALFRRSGVVKVSEINDLFSCSEACAHGCLPRGPRLAIITNAGGPGIMATDVLFDQGGELASFSDNTIDYLEENLKPYASKSNPIDISSDAKVQDYCNCIEACLEDNKVDGILLIYAPQGESSSDKLAKTIVKRFRRAQKPLLACLMGGEKVEKSKNILSKGKILIVDTPEQGVRVFLYMYEYLRNKELLYEIPKPLSTDNIPISRHLSQREYLKSMTERLLSEDRTILMEDESKKFLTTYGIPTLDARVAKNPDKAAYLATLIGFPVVLKIRSPDIIDKKVGEGIISSLESKSGVKEAFKKLMNFAKDHYPESEIRGVTVQRCLRDKSFELKLGSIKDPRFGSFINIGRGGIEGDLYQDKSVDFPPLNQVHAKRFLECTKIPELLKKTPGKFSKRMNSLIEYLSLFSQMIIDFSEIKRMEIDLAVTKDSFYATDARTILDKSFSGEEGEHDHLIMKPYPLKYIEEKELKDGSKVTIRPIKPEDEPLIFDLFDSFSKETWRRRFFGPIREITHDEMIRFTNLDYDREIGLVGEREEKGEKRILGIGGLTMKRGNSGEFAVVVGDPWQGLGLGSKLTEALIEIGKDRDLEKIWASVQKDNFQMLELCKKLGFQIETEHTDTKRMVKIL